MHRIKQLPPALANQIAAGEVVERPSAVVKELLENSIDANSKRIIIEIENGGTNIIRIRDDGIGITKEDLPLALARHATSKLTTIEDLYQISSLGFRGEALASIASVSRFSLISRHHQANHAWQLKTEGKDLTNHIEPAAHPIGTSIEVANLFYNVPARKKFLKSARTEFIHIEEVVKRIALSHFQIGFTLKHNDKVILQLHPINEKTQANHRIAKIFGHSFIKQAIYFEQENLHLKLNGWFGKTEFSRSQNDQQYFYINGRIIKDKLINHAIRQAWHNAFPEGRFPAYVLYLELPVTEVDVNVHPTKHEVRFKEARLIHDFIFQSIDNLLINDTYQSVDDDGVIEQSEQTFFDAIAMAQSPTHQSQYYSPQISLNTQIREPTPTYQYQSTTNNSKQSENTLSLLLLYHYGQFGIISVDNHLYVADILNCLIKLMRDQLNHLSEIKSQPLLLPIKINLDKNSIAQSETVLAILSQFSIDISVISDDTLIIRALPSLLKYIDWSKSLTLLIKQNITTLDDTINILKLNTQLPVDTSELNKILNAFSSAFNQLCEKKYIKPMSENLLKKLF